MTIELARRRLIAKPWGTRDLAPWDTGAHDGSRVGEIWYERGGQDTPDSSLLLKILFTTEQLSIQVHPDDAHAKAMGFKSGKTEAWYVLDAASGAQVAVGLDRSLSAAELRRAAIDGSLATLVKWRSVWAGDTVLVPAGTIHSLGAGLVVAEIQQCGGTTFRLLDPRFDRDLHIDQAVEVACAALGPEQPRPHHFDEQRLVLVRNPHFILERLDLPAGSDWSLKADLETWLLVVDGDGHAGSFEVAKGSGLYASSDRVAIKAGAEGLVCLVAYAGADRPAPGLLECGGRSAHAYLMLAPVMPERSTPSTAPETSELVKETR